MAVKQYIKRGLRFVLLGTPIQHISANIFYLMPARRLEGKKIIITGGGKGLGKAMAQKFINEGAQVLISGRNEARLKETAEQIGCLYLKLDVQNTDTLSAFILEADKILGGSGLFSK